MKTYSAEGRANINSAVNAMMPLCVIALRSVDADLIV